MMRLRDCSRLRLSQPAANCLRPYRPYHPYLAEAALLPHQAEGSLLPHWKADSLLPSLTAGSLLLHPAAMDSLLLQSQGGLDPRDADQALTVVLMARARARKEQDQEPDLVFPLGVSR